MAKFKEGNQIGNRFSSENQPAKNGRRKNIYTILKDKGYSVNDITAAAGELAFYTEAELEEAIQNESLPMITRIIAKNYLRAFQEGSLKEIEHALILASKSSSTQSRTPSIENIEVTYDVAEN